VRAVKPPRRLRRHPSSREEGKFDPLLVQGGEALVRLRLVLDTNVWLDWLVFDDPSVEPIKAAVAANRAEVFIDAACEAELERALGYDLGKRTVDIAACIAECRRVARRIDSPMPQAERARLPACRDPDDQKFLEAALVARAGILVTKDRALLDLAPRVASFRIVTPEGVEKADSFASRALRFR
jgi:putative PIN family toxin of toxin-antitoxin system